MNRSRLTYTTPSWLSFLVQFMHFSGTWFGMAPRSLPEDTCSKEIGLCFQGMKTFLNSIVNMIGGTYVYDHFNNTKIFTLIMNKMSIWAPKIMRKEATT